MKLRLSGHDYKYAVEQIMLALFPQERPEYDSVNSGAVNAGDGSLNSGSSALRFTTVNQQNKRDSPVEPDPAIMTASSHLSVGSFYAQALTVIQRGDDVSRGVSRVKRDRLSDKLTTDRLLQRIVKHSFFKAAMHFIESPPVWGSLTGIRPAQIAAKALLSGKSEDSSVKLLIREYYVSPKRAVLCVNAARSAVRLRQSLEPLDIALYIGIPFCPSRCAYCSFVSNSVEKSFGLVEPFAKALLREIREISGLVASLGLRIITVYIGGGTPTALPEEDFSEVMRAIRDSFDMAHVREYTVEAGRPDTINGRIPEIIRRFGARRVCINPQSMSGEVLAAIGRKHTPEDVADAVRLVRQSGLSLNMDIIAGLPGDTTVGFRNTLDAVLAFEPENITIHTLSLKKGSRIMLEGTAKPDGADVAAMLDHASRRLMETGYSPYYLYRQKFTSGGFENTGWCLPGHEGIYNICMMEELCTVLALGGGAVTKLVSPDGRIERIFNAKYPREYILQSDKINNKIDKIRRFYSVTRR